MSAPINDGGPAFPVKGMPIDPDTYLNRPGISIRDYFAAAALKGILADGGGASWDDDAKNAFKAADAMLKAREGK